MKNLSRSEGIQMAADAARKFNAPIAVLLVVDPSDVMRVNSWGCNRAICAVAAGLADSVLAHALAFDPTLSLAAGTKPTRTARTEVALQLLRQMDQQEDSCAHWLLCAARRIERDNPDCTLTEFIALAAEAMPQAWASSEERRLAGKFD